MKNYGYLIDMDGVIYKSGKLLPGAVEFVDYLKGNDIPFLFLTNNSRPTRRDIVRKLARMNIDVTEENVYTSAIATAVFLESQKKGGSAYVIGEGGLLKALYDHGYTITDSEPDFVVVGEGRTLTLEMVEKAIDFIIGGAKLVATNLDPPPKMKGWMKPGTGAIVAMLEEASGMSAFSVGKPCPIMLRAARKQLDLPTDQTVIIGDTMITDILGGVLMGYKTILTLTGATTRDDLKKYVYQPHFIVESIGDVIDIIRAKPDESERPDVKLSDCVSAIFSARENISEAGATAATC